MQNRTNDRTNDRTNEKLSEQEDDPVVKNTLNNLSISAFTTLWQSMGPLVEQAKIIIQKNTIPDE